MNAKELALLIEDEMSEHLTVTQGRNNKAKLALLSCEAEDGSAFTIRIVKQETEEEEDSDTEDPADASEYLGDF